ncbi:MAG: hypothetical protein EOM62_09670 [Bacteroidia bacterium]|nr:hypothetical protein [Bacteroidia bacterium]
MLWLFVVSEVLIFNTLCDIIEFKLGDEYLTSKGGAAVNLATLCKGVKPHCSKFSNRESFVAALFIAAGEKLQYSDSYHCNLYSGNKPFTIGLKSPYRGRDNLASLTSFYLTSIDDARVATALTDFGVPEKGEPNKKAFAVALAKQTKALIDSDDEVVEEIIGLEYQKAKQAPADTVQAETVSRKLYPGDDIYVDFRPERIYKVGSRDDVQHTWILQNCGKIPWNNRRLVYRRGPKDRPEANPADIPIPDTLPNTFVHLSAIFNGRGFDGITRCVWDMVDEDGENCFPNQDYLFCVTLDVKYRRKTNGGYTSERTED